MQRNRFVEDASIAGRKKEIDIKLARVRRMLREQAIDVVATDAHDARNRPPRMRMAYRALCEICGSTYARRLLSMDGREEAEH